MRLSSLQCAVTIWMDRCFGHVIAADKKERNFRFLEEALELVQSGGCTREEAHELVEYVFNRPVGELSQEVGGVSITLAALCQAQGVSWEAAAIDEYRRIGHPDVMAKIRAKQASKPQRSPLPGRADGFLVKTEEVNDPGFAVPTEPVQDPGFAVPRFSGGFAETYSPALVGEFQLGLVTIVDPGEGPLASRLTKSDSRIDFIVSTPSNSSDRVGAMYNDFCPDGLVGEWVEYFDKKASQDGGA